MIAKSRPISSRRSASRRGNSAVARSFVFFDGWPQNASWLMRRWPPLLERHAERAARAVAHRIPTFDRVFAADPAQFFDKDRAVFDPVPVGVDDRMVEPRLDLRCREMSAQRGLLVWKLR